MGYNMRVARHVRNLNNENKEGSISTTPGVEVAAAAAAVVEARCDGSSGGGGAVVMTVVVVVRFVFRFSFPRRTMHSAMQGSNSR